MPVGCCRVVVVEKTVAGGSKETEVVMNEQTARMGVNDWKVRQNVQQASMPAMTQEDKQRIESIWRERFKD